MGAVVTECGHKFHTKCLIGVRNNVGKIERCPLCNKNNLDESKLKKLSIIKHVEETPVDSESSGIESDDKKKNMMMSGKNKN